MIQKRNMPGARPLNQSPILKRVIIIKMRGQRDGWRLHRLGVSLACMAADRRARQKDHVSMVTVLG